MVWRSMPLPAGTAQAPLIEGILNEIVFVPFELVVKVFDVREERVKLMKLLRRTS